MARKYENIENINRLITDGAVGELSKKISGAERTVSEILKKLNDIEAAIKQKKLEAEQAEAQKAAEEAAEKRKALQRFRWCFSFVSSRFMV